MTYVQADGRITTAATENPMTETAPERIWATHSETWGAVELGQWADTVRHKGGEEYVHHSLLDEAVKALEEIDKKFEYHNFLESSPVRHLARATLAKLRSKP